MATAEPHLPVIGNLQVSYVRKEPPEIQDKGQKDVAKLTEAASFLAGWELGTLQRVTQPRPGDVYHHPHTVKQPRPLGLLPDRGARLDTLRELTKILSPAPPASAPAIAYHRNRTAQESAQDMQTNSVLLEEKGSTKPSASDVQPQEGLISATVSGKPGVSSTVSKPSKPTRDSNSPGILFRHPGKDNKGAATQSQLPENQHTPLPVAALKEQVDDHEYMDTLAKCNIKEYGLSDPRIPTGLMRRTRTLPGAALQGYSNSSQLPNVQLSPGRKTAKLGRMAHSRSASLEYVTFTGQAQLFNRMLTADIRDALGYEPCERCRLKGGRCARCKALRTGGGYIILDTTDLPEEDNKLRRFGRFYGFGDGGRSGYGENMEGKLGRRRHRSTKDNSLKEFGGVHSTEGFGDGDGPRGGGGKLRDGGGSGRGWGDFGGGDRVGGEGVGGRVGDTSGRLGSAYDRGQGLSQRISTAGGDRDGDEDGRGFYGGEESSGRTRLGSALHGRRGTEDQPQDGADGFDSGRQSSTSHRPVSRMAGSRPGSMLGSRPGSSMRRGGKGIERRDRIRRMGDTEGDKDGVKGHGRRRGEGGSGSDSGDDEEGRRRRRRRGANKDDTDKGKGDYDPTKFAYHHEGEEEQEEDTGFHGDLIRFRSKRDNVKALQCTLKELQGIDPLDYLAKYCIIDQEKLPHYRRVYDNVDRDEDDEIDILELDFALKAVNYNLISDAEMSYIHSVLELAGRYKLNFRLFSLIAALSEKVVALEDMVKRLINKMDFEALAVKLKKCKELFYLLADAESSQEHEGGVVTTSNLAVELQAGGLTQEHVEYVVERLNHEGRGFVEFLDYLTYVPLFVEIHDSIYGNPLDFTRTK